MDTYHDIDLMKCTECKECIEACPEKFLTYEQTGCDFDGNPLPPMIGHAYEYVPCHHCEGFWENQTPCQKACKQEAITITRW